MSAVSLCLKKFGGGGTLNLFTAKKFFLVRCPKKRLISFYKEKFKQYPLRASKDKNNPWQHTQQIFFPLLNIDQKKHSFEFIKNKLLNTSFEDFMNFLPYVYKKDEHVLPQSYGVKARTFLFLFNIKILKMEEASDLNYLSNIIGLDLSKKHNNTDAIQTPVGDLTPELKFIYRHDFILFGYEK